MYRSIAVAAAAIATLACVAGRSVAQSDGAAAGYVALTLTPTGGLTPVVRPWMAGIPQSGIGIDARWGSFKAGDTHMNSLVAGISVPLASGRGDLTVSGGYLTMDCEDCSGEFVASLAAERGLSRKELDAGGAQFGLGINGSLGFGTPDGATLLSATVGAPIYFAAGKAGKVQVVPFLTPALGWGLVSPDQGDSESGMRFTAGGGVGIVNVAPGLNLHLGAQKTFIQGGKTVFGAGLTYMIPR